MKLIDGNGKDHVSLEILEPRMLLSADMLDSSLIGSSIQSPLDNGANRTWYVSAITDPAEDGSSDHPFDSIQQAINAAVSGDVITVRPGSYNENIAFGGKNLVVQSTAPGSIAVQNTTKILGNVAESATVTFAGTEDATCKLAGFMIARSGINEGAGVVGNGTHATIEYNHIRNSRGGVFSCDGLIQYNDIEDNLAGVSMLGLVGLTDCNGTIRYNTIARNGSGLVNCDGLIEHNVISDNNTEYIRTQSDGGGLYACDGIIQYNQILDNEALSNGGGIYNCTGIIQYNLFQDNRAERGGGGCTYGVLRGNVFVHNISWHPGGGLWACSGGPTIIMDCVFLGNGTYSDSGRALRVTNNIASIVNCTFYDDDIMADSSATFANCMIDGISSYSGEVAATLRYCDVLGSGGSGAGWNASMGIDGGGNIDAAPTFANAADPDGVDNTYWTQDDGLRLASGSAGIDAGWGDASSVRDILGSSRWDDPSKANSGSGVNAYTDMGAYERFLTSQINATSWYDADRDGIHDATETGISGRTIFLDDNQNAQQDSGERSGTTNVSGTVIFTGLTPGTDIVAEVLGGSQRTAPVTKNEFGVNTYVTGDQNAPSVAMNASGTTVEAWASYGQDGSDYGVYVRQYQTDGTAIGSAFRVNNTSAGFQGYPSLAVNSQGRFAVIWQSGQPSLYDVFARIYSSTGAAITGEIKLTATPGWNPDIAMNSSGELVTAWSSGNSVFMQRLGPAGDVIGSPVVVSQGQYRFNPAVSLDDAGNAVVVWTGTDSGSTTGYDIFARAYNADGVPWSDERQVNTYVSGNQSIPVVAMDQHANYLVSWASDGSDGNGKGVAARRFSGFGPEGTRTAITKPGEVAAVEFGSANATWWVDDVTDPIETGTPSHPFHHIQYAMNTAQAGDTIMVQPGTYYENLVFGGKNLTVTSTDPNNASVVSSTIIDGRNGSTSQATVTFAGTESVDCKIAGFTIQKGGTSNIVGNGTSATIEHSVIQQNRGTQAVGGKGGGINDCDGLIQYNTITGNRFYSGSSVALYDCDGTIQYNTISGNGVDQSGGGAVGYCDGTIQYNTVSNNDFNTGGGGLNYCNGLIQYNTISGNTSITYVYGMFGCNGLVQCNTVEEQGGTTNGAAVSECQGVIQYNVVRNNDVNGFYGCGGTIDSNMIISNRGSNAYGIYTGYDDSLGLPGLSPVISNCVFYNNTGAIYVGTNCSPAITNCTFYDNPKSGKTGPGVFNHNSSATFANCLIWDTVDTSSSNGKKPIFRYSDVRGSGGSGAGWHTAIGWDEGGNIDLTPSFVNASDGDGPDNQYFTKDDGFRLRASSPGIDAADGGAIPDTDILGYARRDLAFVPNTGRATPNYADMGAYEFVCPIGDANMDNTVNDADYTIWADNYSKPNATWEMGDWNGDRAVNDAEYTIWADNYGHTIVPVIPPVTYGDTPALQEEQSAAPAAVPVAITPDAEVTELQTKQAVQAESVVDMDNDSAVLRPEDPNALVQVEQDSPGSDTSSAVGTPETTLTSVTAGSVEQQQIVAQPLAHECENAADFEKAAAGEANAVTVFTIVYTPEQSDYGDAIRFQVAQGQACVSQLQDSNIVAVPPADDGDAGTTDGRDLLDITLIPMPGEQL